MVRLKATPKYARYSFTTLSTVAFGVTLGN